MRRIAIIFNKKSGVSNKLAEIREYFAKLPAGQCFADISIIEDGSEIHEIAKKYAAGLWDVIVAAGGDGTVSVVAETLVKSQHTLGVLPLGTLNHFAKDVGIPTSLASALELISVTGHVARIDVATCNNVTFINNSSIGVYPKVVALREHYQAEGEFKWLAYLTASRSVLAHIPKLAVTLETADKKMTRNTSFIFVGNNPYKLNGLKVGSRSTLSGGRLSLWISRETSAYGLFALAVRMLLGKVREDNDFEDLYPTEVEVETSVKELLVSLDGEVAQMKSPLRYKIVPQCLSVLVPKVT